MLSRTEPFTSWHLFCVRSFLNACPLSYPKTARYVVWVPRYPATPVRATTRVRIPEQRGYPTTATGIIAERVRVPVMYAMGYNHINYNRHRVQFVCRSPGRGRLSFYLGLSIIYTRHVTREKGS